MLAVLNTDNTRNLEVINLHRIETAVEGIASGEIPGFQLIPGTEPMLAQIALTKAMKPHVPRFCFNVSTEITEIDARDSSPHVDFGVEGVALHVSRTGTGKVFLAALEPHKYIDAVGGVIAEQHDVGPTYSGELAPGILTVFSEGFTAKTQQSVGHTYHWFLSNDGNHTRSWTRHAFAPSNSSLRH